MYYGMDNFGLSDLAASEMGQFGDAPAQPSDISNIGTQLQQMSSAYAQYLVAKNPGAQALYNQQMAAMLAAQGKSPMAEQPMSSTTKLLIGLGLGAAALATLLYVMKQRSRNPGKTFGGATGWKIIGD